MSLSKFALTTFEILNELYIAVASGLFGMAVLSKHGIQNNQIVKVLSVISISAISLIYLGQDSEQLPCDNKKVIVITGCDSGLGFSIAQFAVDLGFTVFAGFLSLESKGSREIRRLYGRNILQIQIDVTDRKSVEAAVKTVEFFLEQNKEYSLHAVINNAGVMVFGEFEWQTEKLIKQQIEVNITGTFRFTNAFCSLIRQHKGRIVTITSHCSQASLPGLSVYGATKAALSSWSDGLRVEMAKYGVGVVTFIPGSFVLQSDIMAKQLQYAQEMHDSFTSEQHVFYSDYFKRYNVYLSFITPPPQPTRIVDEKMYKTFKMALLDKYPRVVYKNEDLRYKVYHFMFKFSPWFIRDWLVVKFMAMPRYKVSCKDDMEDDDDEMDL